MCLRKVLTSAHIPNSITSQCYIQHERMRLTFSSALVRSQRQTSCVVPVGIRPYFSDSTSDLAKHWTKSSAIQRIKLPALERACAFVAAGFRTSPSKTALPPQHLRVTAQLPMDFCAGGFSGSFWVLGSRNREVRIVWCQETEVITGIGAY